MIREHGPASSTMKLCLFTVNAFMDDHGEAWPSQATIARAAALGENTVQRILGEAIDLGWLGAETRAARGKAWKRYVYRAAIPDALQDSKTMIEGKMQLRVMGWRSKHAPLLEGGRPLKKKGAKQPEVPLLNSKVPFLNREGAPPDNPKVPLLKSEVPLHEGPKSSSEGPILSNHIKYTPSGGKVQSQTTAPPPKSVGVIKKLVDQEADRRAPREMAQEAAEDRGKRILRVVEAFPEYSEAEMAKVARVSVAEIQQVRRQA